MKLKDIFERKQLSYFFKIKNRLHVFVSTVEAGFFLEGFVFSHGLRDLRQAKGQQRRQSATDRICKKFAIRHGLPHSLTVQSAYGQLFCWLHDECRFFRCKAGEKESRTKRPGTFRPLTLNTPNDFDAFMSIFSRALEINFSVRLRSLEVL